MFCFASTARIIFAIIPDKAFISWKYLKRMGRPVNWEQPATFTEKIQWLKVYWRPAILTQCSDKYEVRRFVEERVGSQILNTLYGVYDRPEQIDPLALPDSFILKVTHGSGRHIVCKNRSELNWAESMRRLKRNMRKSQYDFGREWCYKNIKPRIVAEAYLQSVDGPMTDYLFHCFNGVPRFVEIVSDKLGSPRVNMFDLNLNLLERKYKTPPLEGKVERPHCFDAMIDYARKLSKDFPYVRVDFLYINQTVYFGEMTFYPTSGMHPYSPPSFDEFLGSFLQLPEKLGT